MSQRGIKIYAVAMTVVVALAGLLTMQLVGDRQNLKNEISDLKGQLANWKQALRVPLVAPKQPQEASEVTAALQSRVHLLQRQLDALRAENAQLRQSGAQTVASDTHTGPGPSPFAGPRHPQEVPELPPPPPEALGAAGATEVEDAELEQLAVAVKATPAQRQRIQKHILHWQEEFQNRIIAAGEEMNAGRDRTQPANPDDLHSLFERVGKECYEKCSQAIRGELAGEQIKLFETYLKEQEAWDE